ncbi:MAG TPA: type VI secretion system baseplate subunit TssG [Gammaproteobacteria bacterium]|nr:type VI secretion system baseplate subunit TssG [Gammaproteobacteria bacterium]
MPLATTATPILDATLQQLLAKPQQFDFFQAVRLVNQKISSSALCESKDGSFNIRFRTTPLLRFPANAIDQIKLMYSESTHIWEFEFQVSFLGLCGASGLLPNHYTELLLQRLQEKDSALSDFFDVFNHRMVSLFYSAWQKNQFYIGYEQAKLGDSSQNHFTHMLRCLTGKNSSQCLIPDETRLFYAGYFADQHRSAWVLQNILSDFFAITVRVKQFQNKCRFLAAKDCTRLGFSHYNQLGINTVLGSRVWDCQYHFRLVLGPLSYPQFKQFLPGQSKLRTLIVLVKDYIGNAMTFDIGLMLKIEEIPEYKLGAKYEIALGRNAWLKGRSLHLIECSSLVVINGG